MRLPVYLDYSATTPVDPRVAAKMMKYLTLDGIFGNPSSVTHQYGWEARESIDVARNHIASLIGSNSKEIIFTSGATEANNLALKGIAQATNNKGRHIITSVTEHKAVIDTCQELERDGFLITWLKPLINGIITPQQLKDAIQHDTILVSLMHVNNETGVIQDIEAFGNLCNTHGILFHVDASQSVGKLPINLSNLPVDLMSFSGHKIYGPKGIGVLFKRCKSDIKIKAQIHGGGHEQGIRSGTLPVHQIIGMGEACRLAEQTLYEEMSYSKSLRDRLWQGLSQIGHVSINGNLKQIIPNILNVSFHNVDGDFLVIALKNLAISTGSACNSFSFEPSYVLRAMGLCDDLAYSSIRFSLGRFTTIKEIDYAIKQAKIAIFQLRKANK